MLAIVALLARTTTPGYLAAFLLLRSVLGFANNLFVGATPAAIAALRPTKVVTAVEVVEPIGDFGADGSDRNDTRGVRLAYECRLPVARRRRLTAGWEAVFLAAVVPAVVALGVVLACLPLLGDAAGPLLPRSRHAAIAAFAHMFSIGLLTRLASDAAGGVLQARRLLWLDNLLVAAGEIAWVALAFADDTNNWEQRFVGLGASYAWTGAALAIVRWSISAVGLVALRWFTLRIRWDVAARFLKVAGALAFASLGDFLYAPASYLIIRRFLDPRLIADYGPALQIDSVLLLAVTALAGVVLPRAAAFHDRGDRAGLWRAYVASVAVGSLLLAGGAGLTLALGDPLLRLWLGEVPPGTRAILPWVLAHTVLGGTVSVGRAIMIGMGRLRAYTLATLIAGVAHVTLALVFAVGLGWGLRGIACATIGVVAVRNLIWAPWYIRTRLSKTV